MEYAYYPNAQQGSLDHAVTIIGWNDSIQVPNAGVQGAWIVQNSWGSWGGSLANNDGTFYAAYDDKYIGKYATTFTGKSLGNNSSVVLENELGPLYQTGSSNLEHNGLGMIGREIGLLQVAS